MKILQTFEEILSAIINLTNIIESLRIPNRLFVLCLFIDCYRVIVPLKSLVWLFLLFVNISNFTEHVSVIDRLLILYFHNH